MCPLEKGVRGIETGHQMPGRSWRAGKASAAMESPQALIAPLKRELEGLKPLGQSPNIIGIVA